MYDILKRLYDKGVIDKVVLQNCVNENDGTLTQEQMEEIVGDN